MPRRHRGDERARDLLHPSSRAAQAGPRAAPEGKGVKGGAGEVAFASGRGKGGGDAAAIARGAGVNLLTLVAKLGRPLFYFLAARLYGAETFGLYFLTWTYIDILAKAAFLGLDKGLVRFVSHHASRGDDRGRLGSVRTAMACAGCVSFLLSLLLFLFAHPLTHLLGNPALFSPLRIMSMTVFFQTTGWLIVFMTMGHKIMKYQLHVRGLLEPFLLIGFLVLFRFLDLGLVGLCLAHLLMMACVFGYTLVVGMRFVPWSRWFERPFHLDREMLRFSGSIFLADTIGNLNLRIDVMILGAFAPAKVVGIYGIMQQMSNAAMMLRFAFDWIANPIFSELHTRREVGRLQETYRLITRWIFLVTIPVILFIALFGGDLAALVGPEYRQGYPWLLTLLGGMTVVCLFGLSGHLLAMTGNPRPLLASQAIALASGTLLTWLLIHFFGAQGAAVGGAYTLSATFLLTSWFVWRILGIHPFSWRLAKPMGAGVLSALLLRSLDGWIAPLAPWHPILGALLLLVSYVGLLFLFGLEREERDLLRRRREGKGGLFSDNDRKET
ncbi:MAG: polysaccharide biosynthesis protein [Deltaproteobacteria bacterium]|nr:MAG: polysaccharide biosynthesis protein [Deltaproteobacteria bacterium]